MKKLLITSFIIIGTFGSCSDFLKEELVSTLTQEHFNTPAGIEDLVNGAYEGLRFHHNYEWSFALTNYGTDEFTNGSGTGTHLIWNTYLSSLDATDVANLAPLWNNMYAQINQCNIGIQKIPEVLKGDLNAALQKTRLGEVYFLRGFAYLNLVMHFGGVPLTLEPVKSDVSEFSRALPGEVFDVIISDLKMAARLLPTTPAQQGRLTKYAAQHFLAKTYLHRASERNKDFTLTTDLDNAAAYADSVIFNSPHVLATDYNDLFNYTAVNGPNESNKEIILASQFNNTQALLGRYGNQTHLFFLSIYRNFPGMARDIANGREFARLKPTDYTLDIYDRKNDSRFYKSFKTSYKAIVNSANVPKWTATNAPNTGLIGKPKFVIGDTAVVYIINANSDTRFTPANKDKFAPLMLVRYALDAGGASVTDWNTSSYPSLSKYIDPFRTTPDDQKGTRDGILARLAETYLIAAEAYGRKENYVKALEYVNALRTRAAYKGGEARSVVYYRAEQVPFGETTATQAAMQATEDAFTAGTPEAAKELYPVAVAGASKEELFIHFILNERARELLGEFHRWADLSRTETLLLRAKEFNPEARPNIQEKHLYRPIPQGHLDGVTRDGKLLTQEEKVAEQNPGW